MKVAVMQPYLFPYIGYFQLINAVDTFVFYDDVNFIKQGWINRNRILLSNKDFMFTVPLHKANSFCLIKYTLINEKFYSTWKSKFLQTIHQNYKNAPYFAEVNDLVISIFNRQHSTISSLAIDSVMTISKYLDIRTTFYISSERYLNRDLAREERLLDICRKENATVYINAWGGSELYSRERFNENGVNLSFIKALPLEYKQFSNDFVPWLSIIDVLMFNSVEAITPLLLKYELA